MEFKFDCNRRCLLAAAGIAVVIAGLLVFLALWTGLIGGRTEMITVVERVYEEPTVEVIRVVALDMEYYPTLEEISGAADVVVLGTVRSMVAAGAVEDHPFTIHAFDVDEALKGDVSGTIFVSRTDPNYLDGNPRRRNPPLTHLQPGELVVLYLREVSELHDFSFADTYYVPLSLDNGVFNVLARNRGIDDATEVVPRGIYPGMFDAGAVFTVADVRDAIEAD